MAKRKKGRKTPKRSSPRALLPLGFDFGCLPHAMAIANWEFPGYLSSASIDGVAYGGVWSEAVKQTIPTISLVAQDGSAAMGHGLHYTGPSPHKVAREIPRALGARYELADGGELQAFGADTLATQIIADANALLGFLGTKSAADLAGVQAALRSVSAFETAPLVCVADRENASS